MLPDLISTYNQSNKAITKVTSVQTIAEMLIVVANSKSFFWEICKLVRIYFTIPISTATAERSFSMLRWLKTYFRSSMSQLSLNHAMLLNVHKDKTDNIDTEQIAS